MKRISDYTLMVQEALAKIEYKGGDLERLYGPITYAMSAGGKRLRPVLLLMTAEAFGASPEEVMKPALGIEMFHNFTLLHDDVMDKSDMRRGRPTVHVKWDENVAILSGDTMLTLATGMISEVSDNLLRPVLETFNRMAIDVYEGQALDMAFEKETEIDEEAYIRMIELKTGALLGASAKIGALLGGASIEQADAMYDFGMALGVAFQIEDDRLDTFGDANTFGKPIGGDILNDKKTFLAVTAMNRKDELGEAYRAAVLLTATETKVKTITRIFEKMALPDTCRNEVARYSKLALSALKRSGLSDENRELFRALIDKLTGRKK